MNDKEDDIEKQVWTVESEAPFHRGVYLRLPTIFSILFLRPGHVSFDDTWSTFIFFFLGSINLETSYREMTNTYGWIDSFIRRDLSITINFFSTFSIFVETDRNRHIEHFTVSWTTDCCSYWYWFMVSLIIESNRTARVSNSIIKFTLIIFLTLLIRNADLFQKGEGGKKDGLLSYSIRK